MSDDLFTLRTRHQGSGRRPRGAKRPEPTDDDPTQLPEVREMVGRQVRVRWPDGRESTNKVKDTVVVGDRVALEEGFVVRHAPRRTELRRGGNSGVRLVCANADALVIVTATLEPPFRAGLVDRMLVAASAGGMDGVIVLNKCDQGMPEEVLDRLARYEALGYPVFLLSATQDKGIEPLRAWMAGKVCVLAGHSGVGKSTLLQALVPGTVREAGELDEWGRGRHTTTGACAFDLPGGGTVVDLPGIREYGIEFVLREELREHFPEIHALRCKYADCVHDGEDGCTADDEIEEERLESYRKLLGELS